MILIETIADHCKNGLLMILQKNPRNDFIRR